MGLYDEGKTDSPRPLSVARAGDSFSLFTCRYLLCPFIGSHNKQEGCYSWWCELTKCLHRSSTDEFWEGTGGQQLLAALLPRCLFQRALWTGRALEPLSSDGGLVRHALPHHISFSPQCDFLKQKEVVRRCIFQVPIYRQYGEEKQTKLDYHSWHFHVTCLLMSQACYSHLFYCLGIIDLAIA